MRRLIDVMMAGAMFIATSALAATEPQHGGHAHEKMTQNTATSAATKKRDELVKAGKIEASWSGVAVKAVEQKTFSKGPEWVVTFQNDAAADPSKRTLYVFYDRDGHFLAANFTGR
jgi:hypothetical protein